jgi:hypothetical protein
MLKAQVQWIVYSGGLWRPTNTLWQDWKLCSWLHLLATLRNLVIKRALSHTTSIFKTLYFGILKNCILFPLLSVITLIWLILSNWILVKILSLSHHAAKYGYRLEQFKHCICWLKSYSGCMTIFLCVKSGFAIYQVPSKEFYQNCKHL